MSFFQDASGGGIGSSFGQDLAYDLRQIYAKLVGEHLQDIAEARKADNYSVWFKNLEDLHVIIRHKFKDRKKDEEDYNILITKTSELANKFSSVWLGKVKVPVQCYEIENSLRDIEMFLWDKMNDANMFGSSKRIEGL